MIKLLRANKAISESVRFLQWPPNKNPKNDNHVPCLIQNDSSFKNAINDHFTPTKYSKHVYQNRHQPTRPKAHPMQHAFMAVIPPDTNCPTMHSQTCASSNLQVAEPVRNPDNCIPLQQFRCPTKLIMKSHNSVSNKKILTLQPLPVPTKFTNQHQVSPPCMKINILQWEPTFQIHYLQLLTPSNHILLQMNKPSTKTVDCNFALPPHHPITLCDDQYQLILYTLTGHPTNTPVMTLTIKFFKSTISL